MHCWSISTLRKNLFSQNLPFFPVDKRADLVKTKDVYYGLSIPPTAHFSTDMISMDKTEFNSFQENNLILD